MGGLRHARNPAEVSRILEETIPECQAGKRVRLRLRKPLEEDNWKAVFGKTERTV